MIVEDALPALLRNAGIDGPCELVSLKGGANNQVFRVAVGESNFVLKRYFRHEGDRRDRLGHEFAFSSFAYHEAGLRCIPRPLAADVSAGLALYEFVDGQKITGGDIAKEHVRQALHFFIELNRQRHRPSARQLPPASEASFSIAEHIACVQRRINRLTDEGFLAGENSAVERAARDFVNEQLVPARDRLFAGLQRACVVRPELGRPLAEADRCLSPSDFGFHNALLRADDVVVFFDFEYAGQDDPAKMVGDFFSQPEVPVPDEYFDWFCAAVADQWEGSAGLLARIKLLLPLYRLKWCCIILNIFLNVDAHRRLFAGEGDFEAARSRQLLKARHALERVDLEYPDRWIETR